ncbi:hypothetical protein OIE13_30415 [Streptosporangium sp. NBC_01810]|nr:hypothetical protein [Streptosporangium sp. NBC_01810]WSA25201.1 hypothetical protein OIE13_30415 [Streptosporangium sp. NBC_01810]
MRAGAMVGRFEYDGHVGHGLYEYWTLDPHPTFPEGRDSTGSRVTED